MRLLLLLLLGVPVHAQPASETPVEGEAAAQPAPADEPAPANEPAPAAAEDPAVAEQPAAEQPAVEPTGSPPPWTVIPIEARVDDGVPLLGPWPDDWVPPSSAQQGLPGIDPILGDVIDPGRPLLHGPTEGPTPPVEMLGPLDDAPDDETPDALERQEPEPGEVAGPEAADVGVEPPPAAGPAAEAAAPAQPQGAPRSLDSLAETLDGLDDGRRRSIAEDFLPPPPRHGSRRALGFLLLGLASLMLSTMAERLQERVRNTGFIPRILSMATGLGRGVTIPLFLVAFLAVLPRSWSLAFPFALVAVAVALGWSSRDLIGDIVAGVILTVERRVRQGDRLEVEHHRGSVQGLGLRSTRITTDDGRMVSIPNRRLLGMDLRVDPDNYAPVLVPVPVQPHLSVGEVRQTLQELALLSPYVAPSRPPNVYRDADRREIWIVEARLVHPRYANAFRGALVELADEQFSVQTGGDVDGPEVDSDTGIAPPSGESRG